MHISARFSGAVLALASLLTLSAATAGDGEVVLIHTGDIHGHMVPRPNVRSDTTGKLEGGLAKMYTVIKKIRAASTYNNINHSLLINTGDTLQGSGEALFSRGQVMIDVLNLFKFDAFAPGNWDFLYGPARFEQVFKGSPGVAPLANWNALGSNVYYTGQFDDTAICAATAVDPATGLTRPMKRVLPTYKIKMVGNVKVGIVGYTTARAIAAIGPKVTSGYLFTDGKVEYPCFANHLRTVEKVDLVVMISELEMARDIQLAETYSGVDVILNSDMHERTMTPIVISHGAGMPDTLIVEEGQDGTMVGKLELEIKSGRVASWEWKPIIVTSDIPDDYTIAAKVAAVRKPYVMGSFVAGQTVTIGGNTSVLPRPVNQPIAYTQVPLHRSNFVDEDMPGVVEGSSHDLIADAMRWAGGTDAAAIRGFRYGTHIPAGWPITMEDIFHFIPVAAKLGKSPKACGFDLKFQAEQSTDGTFSPDATKWTGGWMFGYSNVTYDLDACGGYLADGVTERATNMKVGGVAVNVTDKYNAATASCVSGAPGYSVAGYWYAEDPNTINNCNPCRGRMIQAVDTSLNTVIAFDPLATTHPLPLSSSLLDVTEAVVKYLQAPTSKGGLGGVVTANNLKLHRITVKRLPTIRPYGFDMIQPLKGATPLTCPAL